MTGQKSKKAVSVWVPWGNDQIECKVPRETWDRIVAGKKDSHGFRTYFEEFRGWVSFSFNGDGYGSLYATYGDDGGEIYIGNLNNAAIVINGKEIPWSELKRSEAATSKLSSKSRTPAKKR